MSDCSRQGFIATTFSQHFSQQCFHIIFHNNCCKPFLLQWILHHFHYDSSQQISRYFLTTLFTSFFQNRFFTKWFSQHLFKKNSTVYVFSTTVGQQLLHFFHIIFDNKFSHHFVQVNWYNIFAPIVAQHLLTANFQNKFSQHFSHYVPEIFLKHFFFTEIELI